MELPDHILRRCNGSPFKLRSHALSGSYDTSNVGNCGDQWAGLMVVHHAAFKVVQPFCDWSHLPDAFCVSLLTAGAETLRLETIT